ncbi:MAG: right-handed parallel beta-helix repeat-containing protein [Candidatus Delongbacteria bacterium]|nr:right-handed parallel beta-helix repeat-containing protein [Candidatus Delongbacteria bacterium]MBN2836672.1 right-handed parallel beta-helix repeat-containing protein [Candidatus Delongbacteria bacterium]
MKLYITLIILVTMMSYLRSEVYYVGTQAGDFTTIQEGIDWIKENATALNNEVNLRVRNDFQNYDEAIVIDGLNLTNGFHLEGMFEPTIENSNSSSSDNYIIKINSSQNVKISGFIFQSQSSSSYGNAIVVQNLCNDIEIEDNTFVGVESSSSPTNHIMISLIKSSSTTNFENISIRNNTFTNGGHHIYIYSSNGTSNRYVNVDIDDNIHNNGKTAIYVNKATSVDIYREKIYGSETGIHLVNCIGTDGIDNDLMISYSTVHTKTTGIYLDQCTGNDDSNLATSKNLWCNEILVDGSVSGYNAIALALINSTRILAVQNNFVNESTQFAWNNSNSTVYITGGTYNKFYANNIIHKSIGTPIAVPETSLTQTSRTKLNYNNIYGAKIVGVIGSTVYRKIQDFEDNYNGDAGNDDRNMSAYLFMGEFQNYPTYYPSAYLDNLGYPNANWEFGISSDRLGRAFGEFGGNGRCDIGSYAYKFDDPSVATAMTGSYTVGAGGDYNTLSEIFKDLSSRGTEGIGGNGIEIILTDEQYDGKIEIHYIPKRANFYSPDPITIKAADGVTPVLKNSNITGDDNFIVKLSHTEHMNFENIHFLDESSTSMNCLKMEGSNLNILFDSCDFNLPENIQSSALFSENYRYFEEIQIENCTFTGGTKAINLYGESGDNTRGRRVTIENSTFNNCGTGISILNSYHTEIKGNNFTFKNNGIYLAFNEYIEVENNILASIPSVNASSAISLSGISGFKDNSNLNCNLVANNIVKSENSSGISFGGEFTDIIYNTVNSAGSAYYQYYECSEVNVFNNIFSSKNDYAVEILHPIGDSTNLFRGNVFYTESNEYLNLWGNFFDDIIQYRKWQIEENEFNDFTSSEARPFFYEWENLLIPQSSFISYRALFTESRVSKDITGNERRLISSTPGAVETSFNHSYLPETVTVGSNGTFPTIQEAFTTLAMRGINKNTTIEIAGDNYYESDLMLYHFPNDSVDENWNQKFSLKVKSVDGQHANLHNSGIDNGVLLTVLGADNITFENMRFINNETYGGTLIDLKNITNNIVIKDNSIYMGGSANSPENCSAIKALNTMGSNFQILNNNFSQKGTTLSMSGFHTRKIDGVTILNNVFENNTNVLNINQTEDLLIEKNRFTNFNTAMTFNNVVGEVKLNRANSSGYSGVYGGYSAVSMHYSTIKFHSNIINLTDSNIQFLTALSVNTASENVEIYQNTLSVEQNYSAGWGNALSVSSSTNVKVKNNVLSVSGYGYAVNFSYNESSPAISEMSNNAFYADGPYFAKINSVEFRDYNSFKQSTPFTENSVNAYPFIDEDGFTSSASLIEKGADLGIEAYTVPAPGNSFYTWEGIRDIGGSRSYYQGNSIVPFSGTINLQSNYTDFNEAIIDIMSRGISGDLTLEIPYSENISNYVIRTIPSSSEEFLFTIKGLSDPEFSYNAESDVDNYIFQIRGIQNGLKIEGIKFKPQNSSYGKAIDLFGYNNGISINDCHFEAVQTSNQLVNLSFIHSEHEFKNLNVSNNFFSGNSYGVHTRRFWFNNFYYKNILLNNNVIENTVIPFDIEQANGITIKNNKIKDAVYYGFRVNDFASSEFESEISGNEINAKKYSGIYLSDYDVNSTNRVKVYNNSITIDDPNNGKNGFYAQNINNLDFYYNTVKVLGSTSNDVGFSYQSCSNINAINNIFFMDNLGYALKVNSSPDFTEIDNNIFHSNAQYIVLWGAMNITNQQELISTGMTESFIAEELFDENWGLLENCVAFENGTPIDGILVDILGNNRNAEFPTIGAYETNENIPVVTIPTVIEFENDEELTLDFAEYIVGDDFIINYSGNENIVVVIDGMIATFTPKEGFVGSETITFTIINENSKVKNDSGKFILSFDIEITVLPANNDPYLAVAIDNMSLLEDFENFSINLNEHFTDDEGDMIYYAVENLSQVLNTTVNDSLLSISSILNLNGTSDLVISASSEEFIKGVKRVKKQKISSLKSIKSKSANEEFTITVQPVNDIPVIMEFTPSDTLIVLDEVTSINFSTLVNDVDNTFEELTFKWLVNNIEQTSTDSLFVFEVDTAGIYDVRMIVSDSSDSTFVTWHITSEVGIDENIPKVTKLYQNYPNPFNPETTINFDMKDYGLVKINIYNSNGELVKRLVNENRQAGRYSLKWDGKADRGMPVTSGVYFYHMEMGKYNKTMKAIMVK